MHDHTVTPEGVERHAPAGECHRSADSERPSNSSGENPALTGGVRLAGKMNGLAFRESQWLLDNGGNFVQVTELLYRIAEQANGEHTIEEIAANVTNATEWSLGPADVEYLIHSKLAPLGLIGNGGKAEYSRNASPLAINLKFKTVGPRFIEPVTSVLQLLCNWVVVVAALGAAGVAHTWLYWHHGLNASIQDVVNTPGGMLFTLIMVLLAAVFHEFGHASALRHHGGKVGTMGAAFYIIYPVLYTDVSDNYRLSRWARISTDLGGVYFHILFSLALFAAYFVSHRELLLFAVLLITLEIIEQFVPFIRLDGYWLLCDLTGIPDLFSQMTPFLRRLLPQKSGEMLDTISGDDGQHDKLPEMKTWVMVAFATYIFATIPVLIYFFVRMIISLPDLINVMWSGLELQMHLLRSINMGQDPLTAALVILQIVLLLLPVPATIYFLWITVVPALKRFVDWASRRPRRVFAAAAVTLACGGMAAAFVTVPSLRPFHRVAEAPPRAQQVLQQARDATAKLHSLTAEFEGVIGEDHYAGKLILSRPNLAHVEIEGSEGLGTILLISDGSIATTYFRESNEFAQLNPGNRGQFIQSTIVHQVEQFFNPDLVAQGAQLEYMGHRTLDGLEYDVVRSTGELGSEEEVNYFIGRTDKLIHRAVAQRKAAERPGAWVLLKNLKTNPDLDRSAFAWTLPPTAKQVQLPAGVGLPIK